MRILVTGKNSQLGRSIQKVALNTKQANDFIFSGREELDLCDKNNITRYFDNNNKFDIIINCAAYTKVDKAEEEKDLAYQVNHLAVKQLTEIANTQRAKLIHISTDYVFDGKSDKPYIESDVTNPINIYGKSKLAGERALIEAMSTDAIIIRTSWVYSEFGNNFVKTMLRLGKERDELNVVNDQIGSPTYATDLADVILEIVQNKLFTGENHETQIYHYSNEGGVSWYEFAKKIFELANIKCNINPIISEQYPTPAKRPKSVLMNKKKIIQKFLVETSGWKKSLKFFLNQ